MGFGISLHATFLLVIPAKAGIQCLGGCGCLAKKEANSNVQGWSDMRLSKAPAFAGMTT